MEIKMSEYSFDDLVRKAHHRIINSSGPVGVFRFNSRLQILPCDGRVYKRRMKDPMAILIGVYTQDIDPQDLADDISEVVDEEPDKDEIQGQA